MSTPAFTRADVEKAEPLDMNASRKEKDVSITIEAGPAGLTVRVDYQGTLSSIPAAIERLKAAGVLELVSAGNGTNTTGTQHVKSKAETVDPIYQPDGTACCPVHKKPLTEGQYGLYCSAKARPGDAQNAKGYCALKFAD